jgi:hypothetical protein
LIKLTSLASNTLLSGFVTAPDILLYTPQPTGIEAY